MTHRGPLQPLPFCDSVISLLLTSHCLVTPVVDSFTPLSVSALHCILLLAEILKLVRA